MEPLDQIEKLAEVARLETAPMTDIRMNHLLSALRNESAGSIGLAWPALLSAIAACILMVFVLRASSQSTQSTQSTDTVSKLFAPLQVEMP